MPPKGKYTDPELRDQVKEEIHNSDKGGAPGQWSARKAQMMASEYKKRGGGYTTDKKDKDESQKHLDEWTKEEWQTKEGSGHAKKDDGTEKRYLPKRAWEQMSEKEKEETEAKKEKGSKQRKQYVANTSKAKKARKKVSRDQKDEDGNEDGETTRRNSGHAKDCTQHWEDAVEVRSSKNEYQNFKDQAGQSNIKAGDEGQSDHTESGEGEVPGAKENIKKRARTTNQNSANKKQKSGNRSDQPNGKACDKSRLPREGQKVQWKALPGYVDGEVVEVVYKEKKVEGKMVKGRKEDPRIVLKSSSSGKIAVHKPEAVYFD